MRVAGFVAAVLAGWPGGLPAAAACNTLEACIARIPEVASGDYGIGREEQEVEKAVQAYGVPAVPHLAKLLKDARRPVRKLAGSTLADIEGLGPEHLPMLFEARAQGDSAVPRAIGRIGTPEAIAFLVKDLQRDPETHTQVTGALVKLGARAAPAVAEMFACSASCDATVFSAAQFILREMREHAAVSVPRLLEIARDDGFEMLSRLNAVTAVGAIGPAAEPHVPQLLALRKDAPPLVSGVDLALIDIGSSEAVPVLLRMLPADPEFALARIAGLGANGYPAGPAVAGYLTDHRWDVRVAAAMALGKISHRPSAPALAAALEDADDWQLVFAASLALGTMKAADSLEPLKRTRDSHWYPPVRHVAEAAIAHLDGGPEPAEPQEWRFTPPEDSPRTCTAVRDRSARAGSGKLLGARDRQRLKALTYASKIRSYGPPEEAEPDEHGIVTMTPDNMVEHVETIRQTPGVALQVDDGWLAGSDRGEWGGELVHLPAKGPAEVLYEENIDDIFRVGDQLAATSGLAHLVMNRGILLRIDRNEYGRYRALPWKRLPAAPTSSWPIEGGGVVINTLDGGSVVVEPGGRLRLAGCGSGGG